VSRYRNALLFLQQTVVPTAPFAPGELQRHLNRPIEQFDAWMVGKVMNAIDARHDFKGFEQRYPEAARGQKTAIKAGGE
jgi:hypothetical protein